MTCGVTEAEGTKGSGGGWWRDCVLGADTRKTPEVSDVKCSSEAEGTV